MSDLAAVRSGPTLVATVKLDDASSQRLGVLRKKYFPPHRNFLDAHVTLFHRLSAEALAVLEAAVTEAAPRAFEVALPQPFPLRRGVATRVESGELVLIGLSPIPLLLLRCRS